MTRTSNVESERPSLQILVTGGSGFVGSALLDALRRRRGLGRFVNLDLESNPDFASLSCDIRSEIDLPSLEAPQFTHCIHLAAVAKEPGYPRDEYYRTNDLGTQHVLDLCTRLKIPRIVFTSTMMVFPAGERSYSETDPSDPDTAYGGSKALAEQRVLHWADQVSNRRAVILRPGVVFGPGDPGNFERMREALRRRIFFYVGSKRTVKSCIHIDDLVGFILHLLETDWEHSIYHCAFSEPTEIGEIVDSVFNAFGGSYRVPTVPYWLARTASYPFLGLERLGFPTGIHPRRIDKLRFSTNISADRMRWSGYEFRYPTIQSACDAWCRALDSQRAPGRGRGSKKSSVDSSSSY